MKNQTKGLLKEAEDAKDENDKVGVCACGGHTETRLCVDRFYVQVTKGFCVYS